MSSIYTVNKYNYIILYKVYLWYIYAHTCFYKRVKNTGLAKWYIVYYHKWYLQHPVQSMASRYWFSETKTKSLQVAKCMKHSS